MSSGIPRQAPVSTFAFMLIRRLAASIKAQSNLRTPKFCMECGDSAPPGKRRFPAGFRAEALRLILAPCTCPPLEGVTRSVEGGRLLALPRHPSLFTIHFFSCPLPFRLSQVVKYRRHQQQRNNKKRNTAIPVQIAFQNSRIHIGAQ